MMITKEQLNELDHVHFETECVTNDMLDKYRVVLLMGHTSLVGEVAPIREYEQDWIGVRCHNAESWNCIRTMPFSVLRWPRNHISLANSDGMSGWYIS